MGYSYATAVICGRDSDELCQYAAERKVGIFVWNAYPEGRDDGPGLTDPDSRQFSPESAKQLAFKA